MDDDELVIRVKKANIVRAKDTSAAPGVGPKDFFLYERKGFDYYTDAGGATYRIDQKTGLKQYPGRKPGWEPPRRRWWHRRYIKGVSFRFECKPRDLWIGAYWAAGDIHYLGNTRTWDLWVCILPCFPLHLSWDRPLHDHSDPDDEPTYLKGKSAHSSPEEMPAD